MNTKTKPKNQTLKTKKTFLFLSFCFLISAFCFSNISFLSNLFQGDSNLLTENISLIKEVEAKDKELVDERTYNTDVFDIGDNQKKYKIHVGHINYKDKETERFEKIDTTLIPSNYGWEMDKASYHLELPEYADDWFRFVNDYEEDLQEGFTQEYGANDSETVAMKPLNISHTKGELIETEENGWNKKKILYKNAFGNNIDLEVIAKNIGFDKLVVINEKPKDLSQDLEFSFEIDLDDFEVESEGEIWNKKEPLETSNRIILNKLKDTWFREFRVWDSEGKSGKIRVRIEKQGDDLQEGSNNKNPLLREAGGVFNGVNRNERYIFTKIIDKEFLENAVYPVYTDDMVSYYAGAGDGSISRGLPNNNESWDTIHDSLDGYSNYTNDQISISAMDYSFNLVGLNFDYMIQRAFFPVNTSAISDAAVITDVSYIYMLHLNQILTMTEMTGLMLFRHLNR